MGARGYERISSGEDERTPVRWTGKQAVVALAACSAFAAYTAPHSTKVAAVQSLYKVGHALESSAAVTEGTLLAADVATVEDCAACECDELESLGVLAADAGGATESPTSMDYWELFWTDGEFGSELDDSYVWWTNEELEGVRANVLVDTFGDSRGIDIDSNSTSIFFTVDGCIGRVEPDGLDLKEVFCYDVDDDPGSQMEGLALYEYDNKMYWVDKKRNTLYGAELEGNDGDYWVVSESFDEPIDVAVDERAAALYVVDNTGIYKMDQDGSDLTLVLSEADAGLANFGGLDVDATNRQLFFAAANQIYVADIFDPAASYAAVYQSLKSPMGVAVSPEENLLFFIDDTGVYRGDLEGSSDKTFVAEIQDARFCAVLSESAPTPAPTPVPTSRPSLEPTSAPSFPPTPVPVPSPTSAPSPQPTPEPSFMPTSEPTFLPTTYPSFAPSSAPTTSPTPLPTRHPSPAPTGAPSYAPSPNPTLVPVPEPTAVPTSLPTPQCWLEMNKCGYCDGSAGWECVGEAPPTFKPTPAPITPTGKPSERPVPSPTAGPEPAPTASPVAAAKFVAPTSAPFATISFAGAPSAAPVAPTASPLAPTSGPTRDLVQYPTVGAPGAPTATYGTDPPTLMPLPDEQPPPHANQTHHQNRTSYPTLQGSSYAAPTFPGFAPTRPLHTGAPTLMPLPPGPPPPHANKTHHQTRTSYPTSEPTHTAAPSFAFGFSEYCSTGDDGDTEVTEQVEQDGKSDCVDIYERTSIRTIAYQAPSMIMNPARAGWVEFDFWVTSNQCVFVYLFDTNDGVKASWCDDTAWAASGGSNLDDDEDGVMLLYDRPLSTACEWSDESWYKESYFAYTQEAWNTYRVRWDPDDCDGKGGVYTTGTDANGNVNKLDFCYSDDDDAGSLSDLSPASLKAGLQLQTGDNYFANLRYSN